MSGCVVTTSNAHMFAEGDTVVITTGNWPRWAFIHRQPRQPFRLWVAKRWCPMWMLQSIRWCAGRVGKKFGPQTSVVTINKVINRTNIHVREIAQ